MVSVWSNLANGEPHFTLGQVASNDTIMIFAFAPIGAFLPGLSAIIVPWETPVLSGFGVGSMRQGSGCPIIPISVC